MNIIEVAKVGLTGTVASWEVINPDGSIAQACYNPKNNLILDVGLDMVGAYADLRSCFAYIALGTGTSASTTGMTALEAETTYGSTTRPPASGYTAYDGDTIPAADADPYIIEAAIGIQTAAGKLNGTFTELGFGPTSTKDANLFSRFRICDSEGDPTSVTVASDQQLRLKYILGIRFLPIEPTAYECEITGYDEEFGYTAGWQSLEATAVVAGWVDYQEIYRLLGTGSLSSVCQISAFKDTSMTYSALNVRKSWYDFSQVTNATSSSVDAYVAGSYARYRNVTWGTTAITGDIYGILHRNGYGTCNWFCLFDDPINKPDTHNLAFKLKFSWGRGS